MAFMAAALPLLGTIGTAVGAAGTLAGGLYAGQVASNNAKLADTQADYAIQAGQQRASDEGIKNATREAAIKTGIAANGIDVNSGSAVDVQASQKMTDRLDVDRILSDAGYTAWGYKSQAQNFQTQSTADDIGAVTGSAATLLEKAPSLSGKWPTNSGWSQARQGVFG